MVYSGNGKIDAGADKVSGVALKGTAGGIAEPTILLVEPRMLVRECLEECLQQATSGYRVLSVSQAKEWCLLAADNSVPDAILLCVSEAMIETTELEQCRELFSDHRPPRPVVVLADEDDPARVLEALDAGARAFVPTTVPLEVAIEALRLVLAGGSYVPASALLASREMPGRGAPETDASRHALFTERQFAVIERLREGKPNKIIAYELNMRESTVKVHIRNIMRKLRATNRTQVAYLYHSMLSEGGAANGTPAGSSSDRQVETVA
jgi:DNA-binding NarL/FixJ family response regulator